MTEHDVKIWPEFFQQVLDGAMNFQLRKDDRHYQIGDILMLQEYEPRSQSYTGRTLRRRVTSKMGGLGPGAIEPLKGLVSGFAILGLGEP